MELSASFPPGPENARLARLAEELGYRRVWLYDSAALYGDASAPSCAARRCQSTARCSACYEDHMVLATERDRRHLSPALAGATFTGSRQEVRARLDALAAAGATEFVCAPHGPDPARELRAMADAAGSARPWRRGPL